MGNKKKNLKKKSNIFVETIREFSNITWPKGKEFKSTSFVVLVFVAMYIIYVSFFDFFLKKGFDLLFK